MYRGEVTAIACAGVLKGSTSAPFFCHAEINNRWFVFNAQFPLYYYRQCSDGLGLRQSSHDSLSLFLTLSLSLSFSHSRSFFFCRIPNGLHKCCMLVKQHLITESLLGLLVRAWKNGRVCFGFSVQTLKQEWNMSRALLKIHLWRSVERSVNIFGWYLRLCAHRGGEDVGIVSQVNKTKRIIMSHYKSWLKYKATLFYGDKCPNFSSDVLRVNVYSNWVKHHTSNY